jgi:hypothetical protein
MSWTIKGNGTGEDLLYSQAGTPSLDLRFAATKSLNDYVSGNNLITFTRASTGTFVGSNGLIQTAASGVARFDHNPATGESLGLLVEEGRTNSLTYSDFQSGWNTQELIVVPNAAIAPDGTLTATKLIPTTATGFHFISKNSSLTSSQRCVSVFVKADQISEVYVGIYAYVNQGGVFNLTSGTTSSTVATITPHLNGWYRVSYQVSYAGRYTLVIHPGTRTNTIAGNGTDGIYVWGAQYENGATFPTSYIPTTGATVTRAADVASITGTNFSSWYNQEQGTLIATTPSGIVTTAGSNSSYFGVSTGALSEPVTVGNGFKYGNGSPNTYTRLFVIAASAVQVDINSATNASKIAFAYATNDFALARGQNLFTDTSGDVPAGMNTFTIRGEGSQSYSRLAYYPARLPDTTLQAITQ